jgi:hypothetical protein
VTEPTPSLSLLLLPLILKLMTTSHHLQERVEATSHALFCIDYVCSPHLGFLLVTSRALMLTECASLSCSVHA